MYFLGIDSGGTKTAAVLFATDRGQARALSLPGGNICILGQSGCKSLLETIVSRLLTTIPAGEIACSTFAFAGAGRPAERTQVESVVSELGFKNFSVITDAEILHYSFFGNSPGILLASGTGSVCLVYTPDGHYRQIGGWGYILGDGGSGFHIGKLAIAHALNHMDAGREPTALTQALLRFYHANHPKMLVTLTYASPTPQRLVASSARLVDELAQSGDPDALKVMESACQPLVDLARTAMPCCATDSDNYRIALAGGVLAGNSVVSRKFKQIMGAAGKTIEYVTQTCTPAAAAVIYSAARCGYAISAQERLTLANISFPHDESSDCETEK